MDDTNVSALLFEHDYTNITGYVNDYIDYPVYNSTSTSTISSDAVSTT